MAVLLMRFAGPLQSWGSDSKFETRRTDPFPTKSGISGLLAAALGRMRTDPIDDIASLRTGIRIDCEGTVIRDYHIVREPKKKDRKLNKKDSEYDTHITNRYYLSDAVFLVGVESDDEEFIRELEAALKNPVYPLFLGRRSCPPTLPLCLGVENGELIDTLRNYKWQISEYMQRKNGNKGQYLRIIADATEDYENAALVKDMPVSFNPVYRKFTWRKAVEYEPVFIGGFEDTEHDPMSELG